MHLLAIPSGNRPNPSPSRRSPQGTTVPNPRLSTLAAARAPCREGAGSTQSLRDGAISARSARLLLHPLPLLLHVRGVFHRRPRRGGRNRLCGSRPTHLLCLAREWRLWHVSCFRNDPYVPTASDDDRAFKYVAQSESFSAAEAKEEEEVGSSNGEQEKNSNDGGWLLQVCKIKENLQGRILRFQTERWTVPWTGTVIAQVMILWIATFWFVGSWIVPFLAHSAGFSRETLTYRGQALYSLLTDITEGLAGIAILHQCLGRFRPLPPGWFEFNLKGRWILDVVLGCSLFPLVNLLSHINISLVPMSPGPVVGVSSVEQSIVARDPVAMALYAVVVTVCAPIWEEILFRGFLLPSLTRYMPLPWSILTSAAAFALAHFNAQRVMPLIFLGLVMGGVFARSRNLLASMVLHSLWNVFVFLDLMK